MARPETLAEKIARLRGLSKQDVNAIDRNVRACGLYRTEEEIDRVTANTIVNNFESVWRYRYKKGNKNEGYKNGR